MHHDQKQSENSNEDLSDGGTSEISEIKIEPNFEGQIFSQRYSLPKDFILRQLFSDSEHESTDLVGRHLSKVMENFIETDLDDGSEKRELYISNLTVGAFSGLNSETLRALFSGFKAAERRCKHFLKTVPIPETKKVNLIHKIAKEKSPNNSIRNQSFAVE